ncbi:alpha-L-fucosidase [Bacteroidota bacterium]|nr:alpha-L-fucosidase [Bacteroidota bacterium]
MKIFRLFLLSSLLIFQQLCAQDKIPAETIKSKMQWFQDAKLGIFIHWGIYAVKGVDESWSFYNKLMSYDEYMKQLDGFTASKYNPSDWADLIQQSGARYAVMTTKHHDGVALWNTKQDHYNIVRNTPAKRDLLEPLFSALRKRNLKVGTYFSLIDWSRNDYDQFKRDSLRYKLKDQPNRWKQFQQFFQSQIEEISALYNPDLFWFDGDWEHNAEEWESVKVRSSILAKNPNAIINGRLAGYGDYVTPEQNIPVTKPAYNWWELCMTINNNWGFQFRDTNWKKPNEIITLFADVVGNGGNLLLDIGPKEDGTIPKEQREVLVELGKWNKKHERAVFGTLAGIPQGHFYGPTTISKDSSSLYLFLQAQTSGPIMIKGLVNKIKDVKVVGKETSLPHKVVGKISWSPVPGLVFIDIPRIELDACMTVLELKLEGPVKLYAGQGGFN